MIPRQKQLLINRPRLRVERTDGVGGGWRWKLGLARGRRMAVVYVGRSTIRVCWLRQAHVRRVTDLADALLGR